MRPAVLTLVGPSDSGKTRVAEALIRRLTERGYRVAAVKHCPHGYSLDKEGSDSHRMRAAGAKRVAVVSPSEWAILEPVEDDQALEDLLSRMGDGMDLVLAEGFRSSRTPKVLVRPEVADSPWERPGDVVAVVSDEPAPDVPWQCGFDEMERLAQFVCERFLKARHAETEVSLMVDDQARPLNAFASSAIANTLRGLVKSIKGVPAEPSCVHLELRQNPGP